MRRSGPWQSVWDDRILEVAANDEDGVISVGDLDDNELVRTAKSNISDRCSVLAEHELLRKIGHGVYKITEKGEGYLEENYDAENGVWLDSERAEEDDEKDTEVSV